ncbi:hypothetical protein GMORB2_3232 [Geosmithia morbida]|uniref:Uncharacterized protein n=1 Tax=Geosmithia morbida TaxID=1094350 RepID=A0A9P4YP35_9HYPO|nr:uncharacterized protein GMORB2_3232 [Geosmithia morbida]KAF4120105.1 hypothetical protein GMORB2_3232 [Geosmithia morbida]
MAALAMSLVMVTSPSYLDDPIPPANYGPLRTNLINCAVD